MLCGLSLILCTDLMAQEPQKPPFQVEVKVNVVLVPVVVRDARGGAVGDLKKEDFRIFDQNKPRVISGFTVEKRAVAESGVEGSTPAPTAPSGAPQPSALPERFIVFLFDDIHLSASDLLQTQAAATRVVAGSLADSDVAAVVTTSGTSSGLTRDHAKLEEAIRKLTPRPLYRQARGCPNVDYYQADLIQNKRDYTAFQAALGDTLICAHLSRTMLTMAEALARAAAAKALRIGDQDVLATLAVLRGYVGKMRSLPGQRTLIFLSPGFFTMTPLAQTEKSEILDLAARSDVTISALDARGLSTREPGADELGPTSGESLSPSIASYVTQLRQQSESFDEDLMAELANGTGGTFFHNSNDLKGGLESLAAAPEYLYVLQISLADVKPDGTYHRLKVKLDRDGLQVQARRGYFVPKPQQTQK